MIRVINPSNEKLIGEYAPDSEAQVESSVQSASDAFEIWRKWSLEKRAVCLHKLANAFRAKKSDLAILMAREMGKPVADGEIEITKCSAACEHFAQNSAPLLEPKQLATGGGKGYCRFDPLGPILAIMPWNFPFWQVIRAAVPALTAGNTVVLKHAPNVPGCAKSLVELFHESGFPEGAFISVRIEDNAIAQKLCRHPLLRGVTLTGSDRAGMAVAAECGSTLKKTVMELGGSDPFIVLKDCDVAFAATSAAEARCINSGQSCICAKRFLVEESVLAKFLYEFVAAMRKHKVGDPMDRTVGIGPLARLDLLQNLQRQVDESVKMGATQMIGGHRIGNVGYFFEPTILADVKPGMPVFDEETFGPVAAVIGVADADEAVNFANQSKYGLGASIWTRDLGHAEKLAADLDAGNVFINSIVRSDPRMPFGGVKHSGWGRELAEFGLKEFTNIKTVWVSKP